MHVYTKSKGKPGEKGFKLNVVKVAFERILPNGRAVEVKGLTLDSTKLPPNTKGISKKSAPKTSPKPVEIAELQKPVEKIQTVVAEHLPEALLVQNETPAQLGLDFNKSIVAVNVVQTQAENVESAFHAKNMSPQLEFNFGEI